MNWSDARYVRLYTLDSGNWLMLPWQARAIFPLLLRKVDRAGVLDVGPHGRRAIAKLLDFPLEVVEAGMSALTECGPDEEQPTVVERAGLIVIPNFVAAQEATMSDRVRQEESRARRRASAMGPRDNVSQNHQERDTGSRSVTAGHNNDDGVTESHELSQAVTSGHSSLAVPSRAVPAMPEKEKEKEKAEKEKDAATAGGAFPSANQTANHAAASGITWRDTIGDSGSSRRERIDELVRRLGLNALAEGQLVELLTKTPGAIGDVEIMAGEFGPSLVGRACVDYAVSGKLPLTTKRLKAFVDRLASTNGARNP